MGSLDGGKKEQEKCVGHWQRASQKINRKRKFKERRYIYGLFFNLIAPGIESK